MADSIKAKNNGKLFVSFAGSVDLSKNLSATSLNTIQRFHLNIYFSSIEEKDRLKVIKECYWPILELADNVDSPIAIELTGMTLEVINKLDPKWVQKFKKLLYNVPNKKPEEKN